MLSIILLQDEFLKTLLPKLKTLEGEEDLIND